jgi:hypothetical protein
MKFKTFIRKKPTAFDKEATLKKMIDIYKQECSKTSANLEELTNLLKEIKEKINE